MTEKMTGTDVRKNLQDMFETAKLYRLIVTARGGKQLLDIPLLVAVILVALAPKLAILGAIIALFTRTRVEVVRSEKRKSHDTYDDENRAEAA